MIEMSIAGGNNRWLFIKGKGDVLNPDRVERFYVRGVTKKDCLQILHEHTRDCRWMSAGHLRKYAHPRWGTYVARPKCEGRGVWITRDHHSREMIELWTDRK